MGELINYLVSCRSSPNRFRFIGGTVLSHVYVAIEGHGNMMLIEVDGHYVSPVWVDHLEVHTGQRYSTLFQSKTMEQLQHDRANGKTQYWIQFETRDRKNVTSAFAVLTYDDASTPDIFTPPPQNPLVLPPETFVPGWLEDSLHLLPARPYEDSVPLLSEVTRRITINVQQVFNDDGTIMFYQNGKPWFERLVKVPYLVSLYQNIEENFPNYEAAIKNGNNSECWVRVYFLEQH